MMMREEEQSAGHRPSEDLESEQEPARTQEQRTSNDGEQRTKNKESQRRSKKLYNINVQQYSWQNNRISLNQKS